MHRRTLIGGALAAVVPLAAGCGRAGAPDAASSRGRTAVSYGIWDVVQAPVLQQGRPGLLLVGHAAADPARPGG
ncbi:hypothetical protein [Streptomyces sp. NPDC006552]|uniref:hypothetical protein n=1 Tax=Streptomyces sp. NPDC006552 TaxID=3157179 RepID=UPI0033AEA771